MLYYYIYFLIFKNNSEFMLKKKQKFFNLKSFCNLLKFCAEIFNKLGLNKLFVHGGFHFSLLCFIPTKSNLCFF